MRGIILLDFDDTVVRTPDYTLTANGLEVAIADCQEMGYRIGLNSDSPLAWLSEWQQKLGMNGPIIAEGGAIVQGQPDDEAVFAVSGRKAGLLTQTSLALCQKAYELGGIALYGDIVRARREGIRLEFANTTRVIGINALRQASLMCYVWQILADGSLVTDREAMEEVRQYLHEVLQQAGSRFRIDCDESCSVVIAHAIETTKEHGVTTLRRLIPSIPITIIGNSLSDDCGPNVHHVAVNNATAAFKERSQCITSASWTAGVIEYLEQIARQPPP